MGQQPNIELTISDLPRPRPKPDPARSWVPERPGELGGPDDHRWGAGYGATGPDAGFAMALVAARPLQLAAGEHRSNANAGLAALAAARASLFGRAPTKQDVDLAEVLLGFDVEGLAEDTVINLASKRLDWFAAAAHHPHKLTAFLASIDPDVLRLTAVEARERLAQGAELLAP